MYNWLGNLDYCFCPLGVGESSRHFGVCLPEFYRRRNWCHRSGGQNKKDVRHKDSVFYQPILCKIWVYMYNNTNLIRVYINIKNCQIIQKMHSCSSVIWYSLSFIQQNTDNIWSLGGSRNKKSGWGKLREEESSQSLWNGEGDLEESGSCDSFWVQHWKSRIIQRHWQSHSSGITKR